MEAGKFHLDFFDHRLAMPDRFGGDHAHTVANGIRRVEMNPITILTVMGTTTECLGLGATFSTTYFEPSHVARVCATLDLGADGQAALINALPKKIDSLSLLSKVLNFDFSKQPINVAFTPEQLDSWTGVQGMRYRISGTR